MAKRTNFKLGIYGWRTTIRISHRRHDLQGQRSRSQGHVISLSRVGPMAHKSKSNSRSITKIGKRVPMTRAIAHQFQGQKVRVTGRLTQTHKMYHILRKVRPKNFNADGLRRPASAASAVTSKLKVKIISSHRLYVSSPPLLNSRNKMLYLCH